MPLKWNFWDMYKELKKDNQKKWKERWQWGKPRSDAQIKAIILTKLWKSNKS